MGTCVIKKRQVHKQTKRGAIEKTHDRTQEAPRDPHPVLVPGLPGDAPVHGPPGPLPVLLLDVRVVLGRVPAGVSVFVVAAAVVLPPSGVVPRGGGGGLVGRPHLRLDAAGGVLVGLLVVAVHGRLSLALLARVSRERGGCLRYVASTAPRIDIGPLPDNDDREDRKSALHCGNEKRLMMC